MWVAGLCVFAAGGVAACGGDAKFGPGPAESGAAAMLDGGRNPTDGGRTDDGGAAGHGTVSSGGTSNGPSVGEGGTGGADLELGALPYAGLGPCQFLPVIGSKTGNASCPNATFEGDFTIVTASDIERLAGCQRITGSLQVLSATLTSLEGLESLQLIDGDLEIEADDRSEGRPPSNPKLGSLSGLDGLRCVAGNATISDQIGLWDDVAALDHLVEVGGDLVLGIRGPLSGLRRVFGVTAGNYYSNRAAELPVLEAGIGGFWWKVSAPRARFVGTSSGCFFEGVLGCDWTVQTQSELDALDDVAFVVGSLKVSGSVTSLAPLQKLVRAGTLEIDAPGVASVEPLSSLRRASELALTNLNIATLAPLDQLGPVPQVHLVDLPELHSLAGLGRLQAERFLLSDAPELETLGDLSLSQDGDSVSIMNAPQLENIEALSALRDVETVQLHQLGMESLSDIGHVRIHSLTVTNNARLKHLALADAVIEFFQLQSNPVLVAPDGLETSRFSAMRIEDNDGMTSLLGLPLLEDAGLALVGNDSLINLEGVKGKRSDLLIYDNAGLQSFTGLELEDAVAVQIDENPLLDDVSALSGLAIEGDFKLANTLKLETMPALSVAGSVDISDNAKLTRINLEVASSAWTLSLVRNAKLSSLDGLELTAVGKVVIEDNPELSDLSALAGVEVGSLSVEEAPKLQVLPPVIVGPGDLFISDNAELTSISALESTAGVGWARVAGNPKLSSLTGLPVAKLLDVENNESLVDLSGLEVQTVLEQLVIQDNPLLQSLRGLSGVTSADYVGIYGNAKLPDCEVAWFGTRIGQELPPDQNGPTGPCP